MTNPVMDKHSVRARMWGSHSLIQHGNLVLGVLIFETVLTMIMDGFLLEYQTERTHSESLLFRRDKVYNN